MRVLIAGAAGYVGSNVAKAFAGRAEVVGVDIAPGFLKPEEIGSLESGFDVFYNFAWNGKGGPLRADADLQLENVKTAIRFYREALRLGCKRYVCAGTVGELMVDLPECRGIRSQNFIYLNAKNFLRRALGNIEIPERCKVVWARLGNLYGGGLSGGNLVDYTLGKIAAGEKAFFGPAEQPYGFVHASDCARALAMIGLAECDLPDELYVGAGEPRALKEFLMEIGEIASRPDLIGIGERPDDGTRYRKEWFSTAELERCTGYAPEIPFADGVRRHAAEFYGMGKEGK